MNDAGGGGRAGQPVADRSHREDVERVRLVVPQRRRHVEAARGDERGRRLAAAEHQDLRSGRRRAAQRDRVAVGRRAVGRCQDRLPRRPIANHDVVVGIHEDEVTLAREGQAPRIVEAGGKLDEPSVPAPLEDHAVVVAVPAIAPPRAEEERAGRIERQARGVFQLLGHVHADRAGAVDREDAALEPPAAVAKALGGDEHRAVPANGKAVRMFEGPCDHLKAGACAPAVDRAGRRGAARIVVIVSSVLGGLVVVLVFIVVVARPAQPFGGDVQRAVAGPRQAAGPPQPVGQDRQRSRRQIEPRDHAAGNTSAAMPTARRLQPGGDDEQMRRVLPHHAARAHEVVAEQTAVSGG